MEASMSHGRVFGAAALCIGLSTFGCTQNGGSAGPVADRATPEAVVGEFLEAVRVGDDDKATRLLTTLVRTRTAEMEMVVAPPGSDTAKFQVQKTELKADAAQVTADWTDLDSDGRPHTDRIIWILHQTDEGWRISGMATQLFAGEEPIVLDFENPAEMLAKQKQAEEELARRDRKPQIEPRAQPKARRRRSASDRALASNLVSYAAHRISAFFIFCA